MTADDLLASGADAKRTAALLREARSVLRRLDVLAAQAMALEDDTVPLLAEARAPLEHSPGARRARSGGHGRP